MKFKSDEIGEFIASMKKEIIEASDSYINMKDKYNKKFIILDYSKILSLLTEYMKQYSEYLHKACKYASYRMHNKRHLCTCSL